MIHTFTIMPSKGGDADNLLIVNIDVPHKL